MGVISYVSAECKEVILFKCSVKFIFYAFGILQCYLVSLIGRLGEVFWCFDGANFCITWCCVHSISLMQFCSFFHGMPQMKFLIYCIDSIIFFNGSRLFNDFFRISSISK